MNYWGTGGLKLVLRRKSHPQLLTWYKHLVGCSVRQVLHYWPFKCSSSVVVLWCLFYGFQSFFEVWHSVCSNYFFFQFRLLSGYLFGHNCSLGWSHVLFVFWLFVILLFPALVWRAGLGLWWLKFLVFAYILLSIEKPYLSGLLLLRLIIGPW